MYAMIEVSQGGDCSQFSLLARALMTCGIRRMSYHLYRYDIIVVKLPRFYQRRKTIEKIKALRGERSSRQFVVQSVNILPRAKSARWCSYHFTPFWGRLETAHYDICNITRARPRPKSYLLRILWRILAQLCPPLSR